MLVANSKKPKSAFVNILWMGPLTGTLDAIAAIIWNYKINPTIVFKFIASGAFGKAAFKGGIDMIIWGLLFHYIIAYAFTALFYLIYPSFIRLLRNKYAVAVVFALITWLITNLLVVPLSCIGWRPMDAGFIITGFVILIFTIGLPVALILDRQVKNS